MKRAMTAAAMLVVAGMGIASPALGQSLFERGPSGQPTPPPPAPAPAPLPAPAPATADPAQPAVAPAAAPDMAAMPPATAMPAAAPGVEQVSLMAVQPPEPRTFKENDLITIIISERATLQRNQKLETDKSYDVSGKINTLPDWLKLLELQLAAGDTRPLTEWSLDNDQEFEGEGKYRRDDRLTARVTARVLEVKPNGTLLVEARTQVTSDLEDQLIVLSGLCRPDDVTDRNTIQSSQLFDLRLNVQNTGDVKRSANKGLIPRIFETIFNF